MRKIGPIIGLTALAEPALAADLATIDWSKVPVANVTPLSRPPAKREVDRRRRRLHAPARAGLSSRAVR